MTEDAIRRSPKPLSDFICTLKKASFYGDKKDPVSRHRDYMCKSLIKVIDFDKIPKQLSKKKKFPCQPESNDALYISEANEWYFIEFKNGQVVKVAIQGKIYDSLITLWELDVIPNFDFSRENIRYILVYNGDEHASNPKLEPSAGRNQIFKEVKQRAGSELIRFGLRRFEGYLFKEVHTYNEEEFQRCFVQQMERMELAEKVPAAIS